MNLLEKKQDPNAEILLRLMFFGPPKTKKTWLAGTAAEAGFNTILLDIDHGYHILLNNLDEAAMKRLTLIECRDSLTQANASVFMSKFLKSGKVWFDEKQKKPVLLPQYLNDDCIELSMEKHLSSNTVLIVDSWTRLVASIAFQYAKENNIDLSDAEKTEWDGYGWAGRLASWMLEKLAELPCHVIVIGHRTVYEKYKGTGRDRKLDWVREQMKSVSGPHSMTLGDKFSDIFRFASASSIRTTVDTRPGKDVEGGSRIVPPNQYDWDKIKFKQICELGGIHLPPNDLPYLDLSMTAEQREKSNEAVKPMGIKTKAQPVKLGGLSALTKK